MRKILKFVWYLLLPLLITAGSFLFMFFLSIYTKETIITIASIFGILILWGMIEDALEMVKEDEKKRKGRKW